MIQVDLPAFDGLSVASFKPAYVGKLISGWSGAVTSSPVEADPTEAVAQPDSGLV